MGAKRNNVNETNDRKDYLSLFLEPIPEYDNGDSGRGNAKCFRL